METTFKVLVIALLTSTVTTYATASNTSNASFSKAKKTLEKKIYYDHRETIYCTASFDSKKNITAPKGFHTTKYKKRAKRVEWEHVVPAENFGRTFTEWRDGSDVCSGLIELDTFSNLSCLCSNSAKVPPHYLLALDFILQPSMANILRAINPSSSHIINTCVNRGSICSLIRATKEATEV